MNKLALTILACLLLLAVIGCRKQPPPPPPPAPQFIEHQVKYQGETLGAIAKWYTGSTDNYPLIQEANPGLDPRKIRIGNVIKIPRGIVSRSEPMPRKSVSKGQKGATGSKTAKPLSAIAGEDVVPGQELPHAAEESDLSDVPFGVPSELGTPLPLATPTDVRGAQPGRSILGDVSLGGNSGLVKPAATPIAPESKGRVIEEILEPGEVREQKQKGLLEEMLDGK